MSEIWQSMASVLQMGQPSLWQGLIAQVPASTSTPVTTRPAPSPMTEFLTALGLGSLGPTLLSLLGALAILILGWIIAAIVAGVVKSLLQRTDLDNRIAQSVMGTRPSDDRPAVEQVLSSVVFWIIMLLAIVAALDALNLTAVSEPLNGFLNQIFAFLPKLGAAAVLAGLAWIVASLAKATVVQLSRSFRLDERVGAQGGQPTPAVGQVPPGATPPPSDQFLLSETLGNALYWFVFLFFLPLILGVLDLEGPLQPVQNLLNDILAALPQILKAVVIAVIGWTIARIVRGIVTNLLLATGIERMGAQFGLQPARGSRSLSWIIGTIVYVLILIPTAIAALDALRIPAISGPATAMLNQVLTAIPQIFTAALILFIGYIVGRFVADLVRNLLSSIGFDNIFYWLGLQSAPGPIPTPTPSPQPIPPPAGQPTAIQPPSPLPSRSPSEILGIVVLVGILLFATVAATNVLNIPALTAIVSGLLVIFGRILAGLVVFAVGLYLANLAFTLISSSNSGQARILGQTARIAIIALVSAMALQQMGIAASIVNLAFGLLLGAIAVAIALAFGLGGRSVAASYLEEWLAALRRDRPLR